MRREDREYQSRKASQLERRAVAVRDEHQSLLDEIRGDNDAFADLLNRGGSELVAPRVQVSLGSEEASSNVILLPLADVRETFEQMAAGGPFHVPESVPGVPKGGMTIALGRFNRFTADHVEQPTTALWSVNSLWYKTTQRKTYVGRSGGHVRCVVFLAWMHMMASGVDWQDLATREPEMFVGRDASGALCIVVETPDARRQLAENVLDDVECIINGCAEEEGGLEGGLKGGLEGLELLFGKGELLGGKLVVERAPGEGTGALSGCIRLLNSTRFGDEVVPNSNGRVRVSTRQSGTDGATGTVVQRLVPLGLIVESFLACRNPREYGFLTVMSDAFVQAARGALSSSFPRSPTPPSSHRSPPTAHRSTAGPGSIHYDHFFDRSVHWATRAASEYQNIAGMGSRSVSPRPNDWCSQYAMGKDHTKEFDGNEWLDDVIVMTDDLHRQLFDGGTKELNAMAGYRRDQRPWIYVPKWRLLIHREGRMYKHKSRAERDSRLFVLRQMVLFHNGYPRLKVQGKVRGKTKGVDAHSLMAWATLGVRPVGYVVDHVGQTAEGRENFAEANLEYVTYAENSQRHWEYVRSVCGVDDEQDVDAMVAEFDWHDREDEDEDEDLNDLSFVDEEDEDEDVAAPDAVPTPAVREGNQVSKRLKID